MHPLLPQVLFGVGLIGLSLFLLRMHRREREAERRGEGDRRAMSELTARLRRQTLSSALIGVAGLMVLGGTLIHHPIAMAIYWSIALVVVILIIVLGVLDFSQSRRYLRELQSQHQAERAALEAEVAHHLRRRADQRETEETDEPEDNDESE